MDRFTSNQDQDDQRPYTHIVEYISLAEMLRFCRPNSVAYPGFQHDRGRGAEGGGCGRGVPLPTRGLCPSPENF